MAAHSPGEHRSWGSKTGSIRPLDAPGSPPGPGLPGGRFMSASGVAAARPASQQAGGGATPTPVLQSLEVRPIPILAARRLIEREHYLHSLPGGTRLAFGVFMGSRLMGALALGVGPLNAYSLVQGATPEDCLTLTRLWLSD